MTNDFRDLYLALKASGEAGIQAIEAVAQANQMLVRVGEAAMRANAEHEDLRETVGPLEAGVRALEREVRALREERNNGHDRR